MKRKIATWFMAAAVTLGLHSAVWAAVPSTIPFQGRLTDAGGAVVNGTQSIRFSLWTAATAGTELWNETQPTVAVANGLFNVDLGSASAIPASVFSGSDLFLEIKVGTDAAMTPRQRVGTVVYAMRAGLSPGIANASATSLGIAGNNVTNLLSIAVTFPTSGFAYVSANAAFGETVPASVTHCFAIGISDVSGAFQTFQDFHCVSQAGYSESNSSTFRTFPVAAGAKSFFLVANNQQSAPWSVFGARLSVMFFPDAIGPVASTEPQPAPSGAQRVGNSQR